MRYLICGLLICCFIAGQAQDQESKVRTPLYDVEADAAQQIKDAIDQAKRDQKHVLLKIGGNWCTWCYVFNDVVQDNADIKSAMDTHYVVAHINHSRGQPNSEVMKQLGFPQRFGFPVLVVLDADGVRLHTQNSAYLERDTAYDEKELLRFLNQWSPGALNPVHYNE